MSVRRADGGASQAAAAEAAARAAREAAARAAREAAARAAREAAEKAAAKAAEKAAAKAEKADTAARQRDASSFESASNQKMPKLDDTRAPATSLLTENSRDGKANCLDVAADWVNKSSPELRNRSELVFLGDQRKGAEGQTGHVVVRQGERVMDPTNGKNYDDMRSYLREQPQYREVGSMSANTAARVFSAAPGSPERAQALADGKVSPELQRMMVADSPAPKDVPNPVTTESRKLEIPGQPGPVSVEYSDKLDKDVKRENGYVTVSIDAQTSVSASGSIDLKKVSVGGGVSTGDKMSYELKMKEADFEKLKKGELAPPHPLKPESLPDGASLRMEQTQFKGTSLEAGISFHAVELGLSGGSKEGKGMSIDVSRKGDKVQVTAGPTEFLERDGSVSIGVGPVSVKAGRTDSLKEYKLRTAEFDLGSKDGKKAFEDFSESGRMPRKEGPGVANTLRIDKASYESEGMKLGLSLGPIELGGSGTKNTGDYLVTHHSDGTKSLTMDVTYGGDHPAITYEQRFGKDDKPLPGSEKFALKFDTKDDNARQMLVFSLTGDKGKAEAARTNDKPITVDLTANDVKELQRRAADQTMGHMGLSVLLNDGDKPLEPFMAVRNMGASPAFNQFRLAQELVGIYRDSGGKAPVPGEVRIG